jgi:predicted membrane-bound mannosyltransferase
MRSLRLPPSHIAWANASFILTLVLFFSSFGTNWQGLADLIAAIPVYLHRAGGGGHDHPWWFYFNMLTRYEWPILLLAVVGVVAAWRDERQEPAVEFLRLLAVAMPVLMAIYAIIPYKTPWCIMTPLFLAAIMAGHGLAFLIGQARSWRGLVWWPAFSVALIIMGHTAWKLSFVTRGDPRNRYAYVETSQDLVHLLARVEQLAAVHPLGRQLIVAVVSPLEDTWPLPWYLRRFRHTGYWLSASSVPANLVPDLVIGAAEESETIAERLGTDRHSSFFGLRSGVPIMLHCSGTLWQRMLEADSRAKR